RVQQCRRAAQCRRLGGRVLRPERPRREGVELGANERPRFRSPLPRVRPGEGLFRQDVETAGHREAEVNIPNEKVSHMRPQTTMMAVALLAGGLLAANLLTRDVQAQDKPAVSKSAPQSGQPPRGARQSVTDLEEQV